MRQRNLSASVTSKKRAVEKEPHRPDPREQKTKIAFGKGISVFDENGDWTGMMMMNNPIPERTAVVWIVPLFDDPAI